MTTLRQPLGGNKANQDHYNMVNRISYTKVVLLELAPESAHNFRLTGFAQRSHIQSTAHRKNIEKSVQIVALNGIFVLAGIVSLYYNYKRYGRSSSTIGENFW